MRPDGSSAESDQPAGRIKLGPEYPPERHHRWCGCLACAERRAAEGRPPLAIHIGERTIPSQPVPEEPRP
jgi:hypothetical protein